jgi:hypothetical protein
VPLVAVYPKEGTLFSDNPYVVLDATWSTPEKRSGTSIRIATGRSMISHGRAR